MTGANKNELEFVSDCTEACFFESGDKAVAVLDVGCGDDKASLSVPEVPLSVSAHKGQVRVSAHLPHKIAGKAAFAFYRELAERGDDGFGWWVDPSDGECKYTIISECRSDQAQDVDAIIDEIRDEVFDALSSGLLDRFEAMSNEQSVDDMKAYDMAELIGHSRAKLADLGGD